MWLMKPSPYENVDECVIRGNCCLKEVLSVLYHFGNEDSILKVV